jgi:hypothetical protein
VRPAERPQEPESVAEAPPLAPTTSGSSVALLRAYWPLLAAVVVLVAAGVVAWRG